MKERLAIVGTGIAGMACAYFLKSRFDLTLFEADSRPGGHTNTVFVEEDGGARPIDTGFIVYNEGTYPNLTRFFRELDVPTVLSDMSFSVHHGPSGLEYCGSGFSGLFAQWRNFFRPSHYGFLLGILRFSRECDEVLGDPRFSNYTLARYAAEKKYHPDVLSKFIIPMASAVWSTAPDRMEHFPAKTLIRFFRNHGFLGLNTQYPWRTVSGGSETYKKKVLDPLSGSLRLNSPVTRLVRKAKGVGLTTRGGDLFTFDKVVLATHADQALAILDSPTEAERVTLGAFAYTRNTATLHRDDSIMPGLKKVWSSWNYRVEKGSAPEGDGPRVSTTYWMNRLQPFGQKQNYFVTINDPGRIAREKVLWTTEYEHPVFSVEAQAAQARLGGLNGGGPVYFSGSYFRNGFHEDAFTASLELSRNILEENLWPENPGLAAEHGRLREKMEG